MYCTYPNCFHLEFWGEGIQWVSVGGVGEWWWRWKQLQCRQWTLAWRCWGLFWQRIYGGRGDRLWRLKQKSWRVFCFLSFKLFAVDVKQYMLLAPIQTTYATSSNPKVIKSLPLHSVLGMNEMHATEIMCSCCYSCVHPTVHCWFIAEYKDDAVSVSAAVPYHHYRRLYSCLKSQIIQRRANTQPKDGSKCQDWLQCFCSWPIHFGGSWGCGAPYCQGPWLTLVLHGYAWSAQLLV